MIRKQKITGICVILLLTFYSCQFSTPRVIDLTDKINFDHQSIESTDLEFGVDSIVFYNACQSTKSAYPKGLCFKINISINNKNKRDKHLIFRDSMVFKESYFYGLNATNSKIDTCHLRSYWLYDTANVRTNETLTIELFNQYFFEDIFGDKENYTSDIISYLPNLKFNYYDIKTKKNHPVLFTANSKILIRNN